MPRPCAVLAVALLLLTLGQVPAEATFAPAPFRLARLFERAEWDPASSLRAAGPWHVVERLER